MIGKYFLPPFLLFFLIATPVLPSSPSDSTIEILLRDAARSRSLGQQSQAIKKYEEALRLKPGDPAILRNLGILYYETSDFSKSADLLIQSLLHDSEDAYAHFYLGDSYRELREWESAKIQYAEALRINPDLSEANFGLGLIAEIENEMSRAENYFRSVAQQNPKHADAFFHLGAIAYSQEKPAEARRYFEQAAESNPQMIAAHYNLGLSYAELGKFEQARESFKRAISLDPGNPWAFYQIARIYEMQGFWREARMGYEEAIKLNPNFTQARESLSRMAGSFDSDEYPANEAARRMQRQIPLVGAQFGTGGFKPTTGFDSFRDLANPAYTANNRAMLMQLGAQLIQELLNSRRQQS